MAECPRGGRSGAHIHRCRKVVVLEENEELHAFLTSGPTQKKTLEAAANLDERINAVTGRLGSGERLKRLPARRLFAFAWQDDHGVGAFYEPDI